MASERFARAITALKTAFFNQTIQKASCQSCAVGNIVAASLGATLQSCNQNIPLSNGKTHAAWATLFVTQGSQQAGRRPRDGYTIEDGLLAISKTGYSEEELARVEYAFETNTNITRGQSKVDRHLESALSVKKDLHNGLMAVVEVLCAIDGENVTKTKKLFEYCQDDLLPKYPLIPNE